MRIISLVSARRAFWFQVLGLGLLALGLALKAVDYLSGQIISTGYITSKEMLVKVLGWLTLLLVIFFGHAASDTHIATGKYATAEQVAPPKIVSRYSWSEWTIGARIGLFFFIIFLVILYLMFRARR
ncbi:MAG TPA: hypothetical protein VFK06_24840 [Candidatus Angelobacter sp.]|nr:hypothetical protein [Candidatus Angelobacter sp.]